MEYEKTRLNVVLEDRVVEDFFDQQFMESGQEELTWWINKRMEDTENEFLICEKEDVEEYIKVMEAKLKEARRLLERSQNERR